MEKKTIILSTATGVVLAALVCVFNWQAGLGGLLGVACYFGYYMLLVIDLDSILKTKSTKGILSIINRILRTVLSIVPFVVGYFAMGLPGLFGGFIGFLWYKVVSLMYVFACQHKKGGE